MVADVGAAKEDRVDVDHRPWVAVDHSRGVGARRGPPVSHGGRVISAPCSTRAVLALRERGGVYRFHRTQFLRTPPPLSCSASTAGAVLSTHVLDWAAHRSCHPSIREIGRRRVRNPERISRLCLDLRYAACPSRHVRNWGHDIEGEVGDEVRQGSSTMYNEWSS